MLGDIPNFENRKTLAGFHKHRDAGTAIAGEADGSFSPHMAARDLVVRGVGGGVRANRAALELFYRTYIMGARAHVPRTRRSLPYKCDAARTQQPTT